jgi:hypothetical protein
MTKIVADFEALTLEAKLNPYPEITAALNAAKEARRSQPDAKIRGLGFRPGEAKRKPDRAVIAGRTARHGAAPGRWRPGSKCCRTPAPILNSTGFSRHRGSC